MSSTPADAAFILASDSPRRRELLWQIGLRFQVVPSSVSEASQGCMDPRDHVLYWAARKANEVAGRFQHAWVVGADTIVVLDGRILGKPAAPAEAVSMLSRLSGRSHRVLSGVCLVHARSGSAEHIWVETTVFMKRLSTDDIQAYVATGEPLDKAGAYGIQGIGGCLVERIEGSYTNVVGLPLCETVELLRRHQVADPFKRSS
jgi:septum formation protein